MALAVHTIVYTTKKLLTKKSASTFKLLCGLKPIIMKKLINYTLLNGIQQKRFQNLFFKI